MKGKFTPPSRYYLSGLDWFVYLFDHLAKQATGVGNLFQVVLEIDGLVSAADVRAGLDRLEQHFFLLSGRQRRGLNLAPYYQPCRRPAGTLAEKFSVTTADSQTDAQKHLQKLANRPFDHDCDHLACHLIKTGQTSQLVMRCDHRLFDARGAEAFLYQLEQACQNQPLPRTELFRPAHLNRWREKFLAGQSSNRMFRKLAENGPPRGLLAQADGRDYRFLTIAFSRSETEQILSTAQDQAGFLMLMPYLLAVSVWILHPIFEQYGQNDGSYVIPVTIDRREAAAVQQDFFFNHLSFLFFHIYPRSTAASLSRTLTAIKSQLYEQIKNKFSDHLYESGFLMRIAPPRILARIMQTFLKGQLASFSFAHLGQSAYPANTFLGHPVTNLWHTPRLPVPPGIGVFFNQFQGRLNLTLSHLEGLLTAPEINALKNQFRQHLPQA